MHLFSFINRRLLAYGYRVRDARMHVCDSIKWYVYIFN